MNEFTSQTILMNDCLIWNERLPNNAWLFKQHRRCAINNNVSFVSKHENYMTKLEELGEMINTAMSFTELCLLLCTLMNE